MSADYDVGMLVLVGNEFWKSASLRQRAKAILLGRWLGFRHLGRLLWISMYRGNPYLVFIHETG